MSLIPIKKNEETLIERSSSYFTTTLSSNTTITNIVDDDDSNKNQLEELNKKYCGKPICKIFICLYYWRTRNESEFTFSQLAEKLNRILVLPNVGSSQIGTCNEFPFDFYYNITLLQKEFPNVLFKSENDFIFLLKERDQIKKIMNNNNKIIPPLSILHSSIKINRSDEKTFYDDAEPNFDVYECISKFESLMNLKDPNFRVRYTKMIIKEMDLIREKSRQGIR